TLDEPERTALDAERMGRVEHGDARGVERGEGRRQALVTHVTYDGLEEIDELTDGRGERIGGQRHTLLASVARHAFPGHRILVVVNQGLHDKLVPQHP